MLIVISQIAMTFETLKSGIKQLLDHPACRNSKSPSVRPHPHSHLMHVPFAASNSRNELMGLQLSLMERFFIVTNFPFTVANKEGKKRNQRKSHSILFNSNSSLCCHPLFSNPSNSPIKITLTYIRNHINGKTNDHLWHSHDCWEEGDKKWMGIWVEH